MANTNREVIAPNLTINPNDRGEISLLATRLQAESFGALTRREAIERARGILARGGGAKVAAGLVAGWAQEIGLPAGNLWEPPMVRNVLRAYGEVRSWRTVEVMFRDSLGL